MGSRKIGKSVDEGGVRDAIKTHLNWYQRTADYQLRLRRNERRSLRWLLAGFENSSNAICLCQKCRVNDRETETSTKSRNKKENLQNSWVKFHFEKQKLKKFSEVNHEKFAVWSLLREKLSMGGTTMGKRQVINLMKVFRSSSWLHMKLLKCCHCFYVFSISCWTFANYGDNFCHHLKFPSKSILVRRAVIITPNHTLATSGLYACSLKLRQIQKFQYLFEQLIWTKLEFSQPHPHISESIIKCLIITESRINLFRN